MALDKFIPKRTSKKILQPLRKKLVYVGKVKSQRSTRRRGR